MTPTVQVDEQTKRSIQFAARMSGLSEAAIVARLVQQSAVPTVEAGDDVRADSEAVSVFNDYAGHRTKARIFPTTGRMEITDGPLAGQHAGTPSQAARLVVSHYKPEVDPNRNGWTFWTVDDGTGRLIQTLRES